MSETPNERTYNLWGESWDVKEAILRKFLNKKVKLVMLRPTKVDWMYVDEEVNEPLPPEKLDPVQEEITGIVKEIKLDGSFVLSGYEYTLFSVRSIAVVEDIA